MQIFQENFQLIFSKNVFIQKCFFKIKLNLLKLVKLYHQRYRMNEATRYDLPLEKF